MTDKESTRFFVYRGGDTNLIVPRSKRGKVHEK